MTSLDADFLSTPTKKRAYNRALFDTIAGEYDHVTPPLSFWNDKRWKRLLIDNLKNVSAPRIIDFATGTGDLAGLLSRKYPGGHVTGADLSPRMLARAGGKLRKVNRTGFVRADMCASPFRSDSADIVTGGYALRNAPDLALFMREIFRVLKPGGTAAFLDFSHPAPSVFATTQYYLLLAWGSFWGWLLHRNGAVYGYIAESLHAFPDRVSLEKLILDCGFASVKTRLFLAGTIAIVTFCKPLSNGT
jgi:demethylmenaquinone methyltransferase/2-methoxy-6-polyprenyl-1,4-benzoquinol methylase